jgi:hypothetical protein
MCDYLNKKMEALGGYKNQDIITLQANWICNVRFNLGGGTLSLTNNQKYKYYYKDYQLPTTIPQRTGYKFKNWISQDNIIYDAGSIYEGETPPTFTAQWEPINYPITYNENGGISSTIPANQTKTHGVTLILSNTKPMRLSDAVVYTVTYNANGGFCSTTSATATKTTTYTFNNWNTKSDGSGTSYASGASYTTNAAATLYA